MIGAAFGSPRPLPSQAPVPRLSSLPLPTAAPPLLRTVAYAARDGAVLGALAGTTQLACGTTQNSVLQLQGTANVRVKHDPPDPCNRRRKVCWKAQAGALI